MTDIPPCTSCGKPHIAYDGKDQACKGHQAGKPDEPCTKRPMRGQTICDTHGGLAAQNRAAGERRLAQQEAKRMVETLGAPVDTDPVEALHSLIRWSAGHVEWFRQQLIQYLPDALVWGDSEVKQSDLQGLTVVQKAQVNSWLVLYNEERRFLANVCVKAIHAGLAEREVRLEEEHGALIAEIIRAILADLELSPEQQTRALQVVPGHLRRAAAMN